ncbi:hypothetical protein NTE_00390 [Candidatus Nitrososphaera evergladensis SR1]|uniref:Uncharacterized protein n=1 Tax=Candidatus Nitrososphaera evergladensis SR1 TaxID=1459636 RepID=A0A075MNT3_9ARCH|nr:hypothetical protein [Candidatus Nitrososphaera evergladensis]AIF82472.1 hypothetical protein NTE_00390 [Candidatus Nitrososphaera evergladensis SR1]
MSSDSHSITLDAIEKALAIVGTESRNVILNYIQDRYGMDLNTLVRYRGEFTNYLEEMLGDSAEIVASRINKVLDRHQAKSTTLDLKHPLCYICNRTYASESMRRHLMMDHTREEVAHHLAVIYVDDWREEAELQVENNSTLHQLLHN